MSNAEQSEASAALAKKNMKFECADTGNADRFIEEHGKTTKYIKEEERWVCP